MSRLIKIVAPALMAAMSTGIALPAQAAPESHHDAGRPTPMRDANIRGDVQDLQRDIDRAAARRSISPREASGLKRNAYQVQRLYSAYARDGLTHSELRTLQTRIEGIHVALRTERHDRDGRRG